MTPGSCHPAAKSTRGQQVDGSMGRRVNGSNGSTGQRLTFTFTILYMIADDARLTPPRCKKHTAYDDTRLTPHRCKKHTASFARSTGKFPSVTKTLIVILIVSSFVFKLARVIPPPPHPKFIHLYQLDVINKKITTYNEHPTSK